MFFREATADEIEYIYQMGYIEWAKGRTFEQYVKDNQKEEDFGTRYVYVDQNNKIIGSMIVLSLEIQLFNQKHPLHGLGSIVINRDYQKMGYGKEMIKECISMFEKQEENASFILYSDISPHYYHQFNFRELPKNQQRYPKSICMISCNDTTYYEISKLPINLIPSYF
ncbi:GNAT family N-acetyltransferase [Bacillus sp. 03113]|uniref:GNAT family N-acetyltransferase n=1 Tax=Bacillus sp. 03113 TaxID=2578211 RepID=UPI0011422C1E|nr:GNAT family N-acetyltransferase [Bacillus sp. 03113]